MSKYRRIYIIVVVAALIGYIATDRKQILILLLCLLGLFVLSALCWIASLLHLQYELMVDDVSICGHDIAMKIVMRSLGWVPMGVVQMKVEYENLIFTDKEEQTVILYPGEKKRMEYLLPYRSENCGKTRVRIREARIYDLLGVIYHTVRREREQEIIIYPDVKDLQIAKANNSSAKNLGESYDEYHKGQDVSEVFDMRDYVQGDSVKSIHWKLSSKLDRLIIREFGNPVNYNTAIYYDTEVDDSIGQEAKRKAQNGVLQMTASISRAMTQEGFSHHMVTVEDMKEVAVLVQNNNEYLQVLSEMMSRKLPVTKEESLEQLEIFSSDNRFTNVIFVCSMLQMDHIHQLSRQANLTVIYVNLNQEDNVEKGDSFTVVSVPVGKIDDKIQMIEF